VALPLALLAGHVDVLHEVDLELLEAIALAGVAAPARHVEREGAGPEPESVGAGQAREEPADLVEGLHIGHRVGAWGAPDGLLIDEPDALQVLHPAQLVARARHRAAHLEET